MALSFGPAKVVNSAEKKSYSSLEILPLRSILGDSSAWHSGDRVIFKEKGGIQSGLKCETQSTYCTDEHSDLCHFIACLVPAYKPKKIQTEFLKIPAGKVEASEFRYGDIDKDGDIDIAVKLTSGAIYVFHNLSK